MNESDMRKPLVDPVAKFDQITEQYSEKIDLLRDYVEMLNEYKNKMGTQDDTRSMRRRMQVEITEGNDLIKQILDLQQELDDIKFKKRKDIENYNKMTRRLNNTFEEFYEKFTKVLKEIHSKEKIHLDIRQSETQTFNASITNMSATSEHVTEHNEPMGHQQSVQDHYDNYNNHQSHYDNYDNHQSVQDHHQNVQEHQQSVHQEEIEEARNNLEFYASIISERENLRASIRKFPVEAEEPTEDVTRRFDEESRHSSRRDSKRESMRESVRDIEDPDPVVVNVQSVGGEEMDNTEERLIRDIREVEEVDTSSVPVQKPRRGGRRMGPAAIKNIALTIVIFIACVIIALLIYFNSDGA